MSSIHENRQPYLIGLEVPDSSGTWSHDTWQLLSRTAARSIDRFGDVTRAAAATLGDAQKLGSRGAIAHKPAVLVDLHVVVADDAGTARRCVRDNAVVGLTAASRPSIGYVGTSAGLVGLITDMHTLGICDGVTLLVPPLDPVLAVVADSVLPSLRASGVVDLTRDSFTIVSALRARWLAEDTRNSVCV
ncbi:hypothetical protein DFR67_12249 [Williamsia limnetica]|uniref:Uncharacterized protein n=1 Tax=Williamsia limnetica TaxID=882452 RepID=A0A318REH6_WILLI|nr:hypothetical protein [Williamsia limnetica]PYE12465.1 hypothetical protein DFR67_12249 [Williamsia limnetica]